MSYTKVSEAIYRLAAFYVQHFPIQRGKGVVIDLLNSGKLPSFQCVTYSKDSRAFWFNSKTRHGFQVFFYGEREKAETELVRKIIKEGDTVIDVGANIGWYTTLAAGLVGERGIVLAIEPVPSTFEVLKKNLQLNNCEAEVRLFQGACSDYVGELEIHYFPTLHPGLASAKPIGDLASVTYRVPTTTIDLLVQQHDLAKVALMKIDVEGAELSVLKGALGTLKRNAVESLLIEANDERSEAFSYKFGECITLLKECQPEYEAYRVNQRAGVLEQMKSPTDYQHGDNILVVKKGGRIWTTLCTASAMNIGTIKTPQER